MRMLLQSLLLLLAAIYVPASSSSSSSSIRSNHPNDNSAPRRQHVISRIYGPDNAHTRRAISLAEESMERYQTGLSSHYVEYENHPYNASSFSRKLQSAAQNQTDLFQPIRITFFTDALDAVRTSETANRVDFIKSEILPRTRDFWSKALSVVPVKSKLQIATSELSSRAYCGDRDFTEVPDSHITNGVENTDLILYVSGTDSATYCSGSTLAVAVACNFDQFDRPIAGAINFCLNQIELDSDGSASPAIVSDNVDVAIHEAAHVLGMSSNSYRFFWDPETGKPRTPRPFTTSTVTCVDGSTRTNLVVPDENTMKFFLAANGQRYASIVTPKVRTVARNQFNCQSLAGAQLENQPTGANSCTGDHWDERLFYPEALSGVISVTTNHLSFLTLALMEDSGWYKANYTMGEHSPWGLGAGCDFVTAPCLIAGGTPSVPGYSRGYFCNEGNQKGCSSDLTHKMSCTVVDYDLRLPRVYPDLQFQYFTNEPTIGGPRQADYCPVFGSPFDGKPAYELACTDPNNKGDNLLSGYYGDNSACFETSAFGGRAECYETRCVLGEGLRVNIRGEWLTCSSDFEKLSVQVGPLGGLPITLTCPRLSSACPALFCPFQCAGRGTCNYRAVVDNVTRPACECFDTSDQTAGCSDSLIPDGGFLADSSGLLDNLQQNFFDPMVAVFVDHPDKWTTASWAWAGGLIFVFILMVLCICSSFWPSNNRGGNKSRSLPSTPRSSPSSRAAAARSSTPRSTGSAPVRRSQPTRNYRVHQGDGLYGV